MLAKAKLALAILDAIEQRGLTQQQAAELLASNRTNIAKLKRGNELSKFTFDRLSPRPTRWDIVVLLDPSAKFTLRLSALLRIKSVASWSKMTQYLS